jgi:type I restriction enzyme S subunit
LRLTPREGVFKEWLWRVLQTPQSRRQISDLATGTKDSMRNISQASLLQVKVPSPSATEQAAAVESFETMNSQLDLLDVAAQRADARSAQLRHSLLVAAFSGRLIGGNADTPLTTGMMNA